MSDDSFALLALSPLDGRYQAQVSSLATYFSEFALQKYRLQIEVAYLIFLANKVVGISLSPLEKQQFLSIVEHFDLSAAQDIKQKEEIIHHDVKAIEYYLQEKCLSIKPELAPYIHLGLTSEDSNNCAYTLMIKDAWEKVVFPQLHALVADLVAMAQKYQSVPMLAKTHGQSAVPTTVGKELIVFVMRLISQFKLLKAIPWEGKLTGAVGNFNALQLAFPDCDWQKISQEFVRSLGLQPNIWTTQVLPSDNLAAFWQGVSRINTILIDLNQDLWRYISDENFIQVVNEAEVGSSTMPHKVNPIDFENSEGNLGLANAMLAHFAAKLPISRLQRDLSDSTVKRNIGSAFGYCLLAYKSCRKGLSRISPNQEKLEKELLSHWEVVTEGIQTVLRTTGNAQAYDQLKSFSRGKHLTETQIKHFLQSLKIPADKKRIVEHLTPLNYLGLSEALVITGVQEWYDSQS